MAIGSFIVAKLWIVHLSKELREGIEPSLVAYQATGLPLTYQSKLGRRSAEHVDSNLRLTHKLRY